MVTVDELKNKPNSNIIYDDKGNIIRVDVGEIKAQNRNNDGQYSEVKFAQESYIIENGQVVRSEYYDVRDVDASASGKRWQPFATKVTTYVDGQATGEAGFEVRNQSVKRTYVKDFTTDTSKEYGTAKSTQLDRTSDIKARRLEQEAVQKENIRRQEQRKNTIGFTTAQAKKEYLAYEYSKRLADTLTKQQRSQQVQDVYSDYRKEWEKRYTATVEKIQAKQPQVYEIRKKADFERGSVMTMDNKDYKFMKDTQNAETYTASLEEKTTRFGTQFRVIEAGIEDVRYKTQSNPYLAFGIGVASGVIGFTKSITNPGKTIKGLVYTVKNPMEAGYQLGQRIETKGLSFVAGEFYGYKLGGQALGSGIKYLGTKTIQVAMKTPGVRDIVPKQLVQRKVTVVRAKELNMKYQKSLKTETKNLVTNRIKQETVGIKPETIIKVSQTKVKGFWREVKQPEIMTNQYKTVWGLKQNPFKKISEPTFYKYQPANIRYYRSTPDIFKISGKGAGVIKGVKGGEPYTIIKTPRTIKATINPTEFKQTTSPNFLILNKKINVKTSFGKAPTSTVAEGGFLTVTKVFTKKEVLSNKLYAMPVPVPIFETQLTQIPLTKPILSVIRPEQQSILVPPIVTEVRTPTSTTKPILEVRKENKTATIPDIAIANIFEKKPILDQKNELNLRVGTATLPSQQQKPVQKQEPIIDVRPIVTPKPIIKTKPVIDIETIPIPKYQTILPPTSPRKEFKQSRTKTLFKTYKQPKALTPTAFASVFNLRGKTTKSGVLTGLGQRYINLPKTKRKSNFDNFSFGFPELKI